MSERVLEHRCGDTLRISSRRLRELRGRVEPTTLELTAQRAGVSAEELRDRISDARWKKVERQRRSLVRSVLPPLVEGVERGVMSGADAVVAAARAFQWSGGVPGDGSSGRGYPSGESFLPWARRVLAELGSAPPAVDGADQAVEEVEESVLVTVDEIRDHELANTPDEFWEQPSESVLIAEVSGDELGDDE